MYVQIFLNFRFVIFPCFAYFFGLAGISQIAKHLHLILVVSPSPQKKEKTNSSQLSVHSIWIPLYLICILYVTYLCYIAIYCYNL